MFGAVCGDIVGSYYELHCTKDYNFILQKDSHLTDDTVLTAAVCDSLMFNGSAINIFNFKKRAYEYAARYKQYYSRYPNAGFGNMFRAWAVEDTLKKQKSYANGAAMRVVPIGYALNSLNQILLQVKASCYFTHNNKDAINGAKAVASAVYFAYNGESKKYIKSYIEKHFGYNLNYSIESIRPEYSFNSRTSYSVPPAIVAFLESVDYEDAIRKAISLGGDADTMACIAGGIAEAYYKEIPEKIIKFCYNKIDYSIKKLLRDFYLKFCPEIFPPCISGIFT